METECAPEAKFKIGQMVYFRPARGQLSIPLDRRYHILKRLPAMHGKFRYQIRDEFANDDRTASEGELRPV